MKIEMFGKYNALRRRVHWLVTILGTEQWELDVVPSFGKATAMKRALYAGLLAILLLPAMADAEPQRKTGAKISQEQARKIALEKIPGNVTDVTIERKRGKEVYVVEIQTPDEGEKDVLVDIKTGRIVGTE
jgi:uncharacterized membrane protein YkoI